MLAATRTGGGGGGSPLGTLVALGQHQLLRAVGAGDLELGKSSGAAHQGAAQPQGCVDRGQTPVWGVLARLAVGCGDCQLCFLEGQRTLLSQAWPVSDSLLRRREEPPAGSSPSQDFHPCPSCCIPGLSAIPELQRCLQQRKNSEERGELRARSPSKRREPGSCRVSRQFHLLVWDRCPWGTGGGFSSHISAGVPCPRCAAPQHLWAQAGGRMFSDCTVFVLVCVPLPCEINLWMSVVPPHLP